MCLGVLEVEKREKGAREPKSRIFGRKGSTIGGVAHYVNTRKNSPDRDFLKNWGKGGLRESISLKRTRMGARTAEWPKE